MKIGYIPSSYPILFNSTEPRFAIAVLGLERDNNLFVDKHGKWREGDYIPAYVRRYPFIFLEQAGSNEFTLCIDEGAGLLTQTEDRLLFESGKPTQLVRDASEFCREFQKQTLASTFFVTELARHGLLVPYDARIPLSSGKEVALLNLHVVDEAKFNALPDEVFLEWRHRGWLTLVYCHMLSMANWPHIIELAAKTPQM